MSVQVRYRREAASFLASFVGAQGEMLIDTTNNRVQVHDGATPGGFAAAKLSEVITATRTVVADMSYTALTTDRNVAVTSLTAARTITLPAASAYPTGTQLLVFDESGACSASNTITVTRAGTDTINGVSSASIATAYGYLAVESNGSSRWTIVDQTIGNVTNNYAATAYPTASNDSTQGYAVGSRWLLPATGEMFFCRAASTGAAVWNRADNADFFGYVAGRWYIPFGVSGVANGTAPGAGAMRLFPWVNKQRTTLSALGVRVTTTSAGGNVQAALYAADPVTKRPIGPPLASTASMSTTALTAVNGAVSVQIDPGLYWLATNCDNATAAFTSLSNLNLTSQQLVGASTETGAAGILSASLSFQFAQTFGTWPDMTGQTPTETVGSTSIVPLVHFSIGSIP